VEQALGWPGLTDGVLWLHAHTKDEHWLIDRELSAASIATRGAVTRSPAACSFAASTAASASSPLAGIGLPASLILSMSAAAGEGPHACSHR